MKQRPRPKISESGVHFALAVHREVRAGEVRSDFCAAHGVAPEVEVIGADKINEAWERVLASDVRYRFVIDTSTLTA